MRRFVIGDIHGGYKALMQCLERANFDYAQDHLISLGDVCDGWPETCECIEELLKIKNLVFIQGNHDFWSLNWALSGKIDYAWFSQGGEGTINSYPSGMPPNHIQFLEEAHLYHELDNKLFVHAGILPHKPLSEQSADIFLWDRSLFSEAMKRHEEGQKETLTSYDEIYIGHTPIHRYGYLSPLQCGEIWMMDTGAAWEGTLSMMDIDTKETYVSDVVQTLYPVGMGRSKY